MSAEVLSLTHPDLPVQTAHCRTTPCCGPLRQPVAACWGRRQRRGRHWPPAGANGGSGGVKMSFEILIPLPHMHHQAPNPYLNGWETTLERPPELSPQLCPTTRSEALAPEKL
jgi:hypothetical protein